MKRKPKKPQVRSVLQIKREDRVDGWMAVRIWMAEIDRSKKQ